MVDSVRWMEEEDTGRKIMGLREEEALG